MKKVITATVALTVDVPDSEDWWEAQGRPSYEDVLCYALNSAEIVVEEEGEGAIFGYHIEPEEG